MTKGHTHKWKPKKSHGTEHFWASLPAQCTVTARPVTREVNPPTWRPNTALVCCHFLFSRNDIHLYSSPFAASTRCYASGNSLLGSRHHPLSFWSSRLDPWSNIFNFLYLIIHNMPTNGSFLTRCEIRYGAASAKIKPCSEISLVLRTILYESFVAKPLSQPPLLPNSQKSAMKPHSLHFYTLQTKLVLKKKKRKKKVSCMGVHCTILCSKTDLP